MHTTASDHGSPCPLLSPAGDDVQPVSSSSMMEQAGKTWIRGSQKAGTLLLELPCACYSKSWFLMDKANPAKPGTSFLGALP